MSRSQLLEFLQKRMSMTDVYQPVIIKELLLHEGSRTKTQLASALTEYDLAVQDYYERIVMRWPKITLTKHGIVEFNRRGSTFRLVAHPEDQEEHNKAVQICEEKIAAWLDRKRSYERAPQAIASIRYQILKAAGGKCQLCGISSDIRPIDVDHIVPRSRANKQGKIRLHGALVPVNDPANLQALCIACNRAKRDSDQTDFRRRVKLVRDFIPELIKANGQEPIIKELKGKALASALYDKLAEEHAELLSARTPHHRLNELADLIEVALALSEYYGMPENELMNLVERKRKEHGRFKAGYLYQGDKMMGEPPSTNSRSGNL